MRPINVEITIGVETLPGMKRIDNIWPTNTLQIKLIRCVPTPEKHATFVSRQDITNCVQTFPYRVTQTKFDVYRGSPMRKIDHL